ncbi:MAG: class I SAM-dependent methyltransferase [Lachnospiraceae bacterium]|nr:class I SAM-dependent methyltransferase [Lachnospiraceae bacterium]
MNIKWNADKYNKDFTFVNQYGNALLDMIEGENLSVLDLGCGDGNLTKSLYEQGYKVDGMDASNEMLEIAKSKYPEINFILSDAPNFSIDCKYDVVFSNAVFHWIDSNKQLKMLQNVYNSLKTNGQFIFEFGGYGNTALIHNALKIEFEKRGLTYVMPCYFPTIGEYTTLLEKAGFLVRNAILFDRLTELKGENGLYDWIKMFVKTPFKNIDITTENEIINAVVNSLKLVLFQNGKWYADYVRLRCKAIKN